jgi:hypothetical protein
MTHQSNTVVGMPPMDVTGDVPAVWRRLQYWRELSGLPIALNKQSGALDSAAQISAFAKLKLTDCARPGNRAGLLIVARMKRSGMRYHHPGLRFRSIRATSIWLCISPALTGMHGPNHASSA